MMHLDAYSEFCRIDGAEDEKVTSVALELVIDDMSGKDSKNS